MSAMIYFDNAATSWPKPSEVVRAMADFLENVGASPGRSAHRKSLESARIVYGCREALAELLGVRDPLRIVFTSGATEALNVALQGLLKPGDHVVTSSMEHNAMMRPLRALERKGVHVKVVQCSSQGALDPRDIEAAILPSTRLIALNHASNVCGTLLPMAEVGQIARQRGLPLLVDAAQTAGAYPLNIEELGIDLLAFPGHKGLFGPAGIGGLYISDRIPLESLAPLVHGGTGSRSEREEQPDFLPDKYEAGTPNTVGIAGLLAGVRYVLDRGVRAIRHHEVVLTARLVEALREVPGVTVYGPLDPMQQTAVVSFTVEGVQPSDVGLRLDEEYGILCRVGLHCAPAAHRTLGTFPAGTVRFGLAFSNDREQVDAALRAVRSIAAKRRHA